jgi:hypothetical protein
MNDKEYSALDLGMRDVLVSINQLRWKLAAIHPSSTVGGENTDTKRAYETGVVDMLNSIKSALERAHPVLHRAGYSGHAILISDCLFWVEKLIQKHEGLVRK